MHDSLYILLQEHMLYSFRMLFFQFIYGHPDLTESLAVHVLVLCRIVHIQHELCQIELLKKMKNDDDILIDMYM